MNEVAKLKSGKTSYEFRKNNGQELVVFVHGLSIPMWAWDKQFDFFSREFSVLRYDMYGKGRSQKGYADYSRELYTTQLNELLEKIQFESIYLVGHSFGGAISSCFAVKYPEKVKKLVLINPFINLPLRYKILVMILRMPGFGKFLFNKFVMNILEKRADSFFEMTGEESGYYKKLFFENFRSLREDFYNMFVGDSLKNYTKIYEKLSKLDIDIFVIYGGKDREIREGQVEKIRSRIQRINLTIMEGSGHAPTIEETERFNRILMECLKN